MTVVVGPCSPATAPLGVQTKLGHYPDDDYSVRCSYVDFDGEKALAAWREKPPKSEAEDTAFAEAHFRIMLQGVRNIGRYVGEIREGNRPAHG